MRLRLWPQAVHLWPLKFNENLSGITDSAELRDQFAIKVNGVERATTAATLSSDTLTFTLSTANKIASGDCYY